MKSVIRMQYGTVWSAAVLKFKQDKFDPADCCIPKYVAAADNDRCV
jgi:hypothetical protein